MQRTESDTTRQIGLAHAGFPLHGWAGVALALVFWGINWGWQGPRTYWAFFPMWLGYCLAVDGLVLWRTGTSLLRRDGRKYLGLFLLSAPLWWMFEAINLRTQNWIYTGLADFTSFAYAFWTTLSFSIVVPAVFGTAELAASIGFIKRLGRGPVIKPNRVTTISFFGLGWLMLALLLAWPQLFFPFVWMSIYFIIEPLNVWLGNRSLADWLKNGEWRPVMALWVGVLMTAFFWEMWNYFSYPKWIYHVAWGGGLHLFEMPLLGYGGYLPFALELYAFYHLIMGLLGQKRTRYLRLAPEPAPDQE